MKCSRQILLMLWEWANGDEASRDYEGLMVFIDYSNKHRIHEKPSRSCQTLLVFSGMIWYVQFDLARIDT